MSRWQNVLISDCCEIVSGATPSTSESAYWGGDIHWATPKDLSDLEGAYLDSTPRTLTAAGLASCSANVLPPRSVLFSSRAPIGLTAINRLPMATNQGFKSFVPDPTRVHAEYLLHWLRANRSMLESLGNGATFKEVSKAVVSRVALPLPPLAEQRRIAEVLDRAETLRAQRRQALAQLDALAEAIFLDMFGDPESNPKSLPVVELGSAADVASGSTPSREQDGYYGGTIPWVKTGEVNGSTITTTEESLTPAGMKAARCKLFPAGSVIVAMYGQGKTRGRCAVLGVPATTNQACAVLSPSDKYDTGFLHAQLTMSYERLRAMGRGGNQENLNLGLISAFPILLPPMADQVRFAKARRAIDAVARSHAQSVAELDALFASLQHRAFRGEL